MKLPLSNKGPDLWNMQAEMREIEKKPLLMVVAFNESVNTYFCQSIKDVIGHLIDVEGYSQDKKSFFEYVPDLVLSAGPHCDALIKRAFPGIPCITARRVLTGENLEQVLAIPCGERVLVISNLRQIAQESIDLLQQAGINHVIYDCYWSGKQIDATKYQYAITPSVQHLCPYSFKHMIDMGLRALSVRTFLQILQFFHLDLRYADVYESGYLKKHVETCRKVIHALDDSEGFRHGQVAILNEMDEGIVSVDQRGNLISLNYVAQEMFGAGADILACAEFKRVTGVLDKEPVKETLESQSVLWRTADISLNIRGNDVLCRKSIVSVNGQHQYLYIFHAIEKIEKRGESIRKKANYQSLSVRYTFDDIWGDSVQSVQLKEKAKAFSATGQTILIVGESGTGKELLAQSIHHASPRADGPFVGINLAAISQNLIESELFGYMEGAFTGAKKGGKPGLFEIADGGTVFLDEIGDAPLSVQVLLLRVLEERVVTRVGGYQPVSINVRIIAATNRPLQDMVKTGEFRSDLYYRLNILSLQTVPLRELEDDIIVFLKQYIQHLSGRKISFSKEAARLLKQYVWPGNFRELKNLAEYLQYVCPDQDCIAEYNLPEYLLAEMGSPTQSQRQSAKEFEEICRREPLLLEILRLLQSAAPRGIGRGTISAALLSSGRIVSEGMLKRDMALLKKSGMAFSGSTKQGTFITEQGLAFMKFQSAPRGS